MDDSNINNNEFISIITPSYKSEKFIAETIESVLNQTYKNWEMIIIDDCSPDDSNNLIEKYKEIDKRIRVIKLKTNVGAALARNFGIEKAKGRFITFIDSDDVWLPVKLEIQLNFMLSNNCEISFTSYELINEQSISLNKVINVVESLSMEDYVKNTIIGFSTSMVDTKLVKKDLIFRNIRIAEDLSFWIDILKNGYKAYGINEVLVKYRVHCNSLSSNKINSAKQILMSYMYIHNFGFFKSMYYFSFYLINAIKKRLIK